MRGLHNSKYRRRSQWLTTYLYTGLECDMPILEAVFVTYPCKSIDAIWSRLVQSTKGQDKTLAEQLLAAARWAGWTWIKYWDHKGPNHRIVARAVTPSGHVDQALEAEHVGNYFFLTFVALRGDVITGWYFDLQTQVEVLHRKINDKLYFKLPISGHDFCYRDHFKWQSAIELTRLSRLDQDYRAFYADASDRFSRLATHLTP